MLVDPLLLYVQFEVRMRPDFFFLFSFFSPPEGYHTPEELFAEFQAIASNYSHIAQLIDITATYQAPLTHEGRRIYALKISVRLRPLLPLLTAHSLWLAFFLGQC